MFVPASAFRLPEFQVNGNTYYDRKKAPYRSKILFAKNYRNKAR
jgi:hypothetical protein